jgi:hypothetical protein
MELFNSVVLNASETIEEQGQASFGKRNRIPSFKLCTLNISLGVSNYEPVTNSRQFIEVTQKHHSVTLFIVDSIDRDNASDIAATYKSKNISKV